jgi:acetyl esterase/lipase
MGWIRIEKHLGRKCEVFRYLKLVTLGSTASFVPPVFPVPFWFELGLVCFLFPASWTAGQEHPEVLLWPDGLPAGSVQLDAARVAELKAEEKADPRGHMLFVDQPSLTIFLAPADQANGCGVIVCPGGGYNVLAWQHEGVELAEWFNSIGVTAFVLKYRVPRRIPDKIHWEPMQDVQRAIRWVRHHAADYQIDANRLGVLGFSAGGHLTVMAGVQYNSKCYEPVDEADQQSARPDFICPIYAAYLADGYEDDTASLGSLITVTGDTPPTFMAVTWDDKFRGAQAALLFARLREHRVPAELHAYYKGGHGYGIRKSKNPVSNWHHHLENWLRVSGFLNRRSKAGQTEK